MSALKNDRGGWKNLFTSKTLEKPPEKKKFEPRPCGELDYEALADEVMRKYPRILARLAE